MRPTITARMAALLTVLLAAAVVCCAAPVPLVVSGLGRGTVALDGPWQFHTGDDMAWANPTFDDSSWEQIDVSRPWGDQGHWGYTGHAWYRRKIEIKDEPGGAVDVGLFVPLASTSYEVYWNGRRIGRTDRMPDLPLIYPTSPHMFRLGRPASGVLAFRASTTLPDSTMYGDQFGLAAVPRLGNIEAIADMQARERASAIRGAFLDVAQMVTYAQLFLIGLLVWLQNRGQKLLFWMTAFFFSAGVWTLYNPVIFPWESSSFTGQFFANPMHSLEDVALWFLLLYLLDLDRNPWLMRLTRTLACIALIAASLDDTLFWPDWSAHVLAFRILDAVFTAGFAVPQIFPLILIPFAFSKRLDPARRFVAVAAFLSDMYFVVWHSAIQGQVFTRWTLGETMLLPLFRVKGIGVSAPNILSLLLVCAIVYAVYRYTIEQSQRQSALQQEFKSAQELQRMLIPEALPALPGYAVSSAYRPAAEVGGDFFQFIPLEDGSTLVALGDVSGKGLKAAMAVSLIVGALRTLAEISADPVAILAGLNRRLHGRLTNGFATCLVLRLDPSGDCVMASAGHLPPFLNQREVTLTAALPLGLVLDAAYDASSLHLKVDDRLTLYTDGLLEARNPAGELFSFERLRQLIATRPDASQAVEAAVAFGQDDDITVLTITRLATGVESTTTLFAPELASSSA